MESSDLRIEQFDGHTWVTNGQSVMVPRMPAVEELSRMIMRAQADYNRYFNQRMDEEYQLTVPDDNPTPLDDRIVALAHGTYNDIDRSRVPEWISSANVTGNRPNINHRLSAKVIDASNSDITFHILMTAWSEVTFGNREPDGIWARPLNVAKVKQMIVNQPGYNRLYNPETNQIAEITFMGAIIHRDDSIPPDEILLFNSRYPEHSARIVNLSLSPSS